MPSSNSVDFSINIKANTSEAKSQISELQQTLSNLTVNNSSGFGIKKEITEGITAAQQLQAALQQATNVDTGKLNLNTLNNSLKQSGTTITQYAQKMAQLGPQGEMAFAKVASAISSAEMPARQLGSLITSLGTSLANVAKYQLSTSILTGFMGSIQSAYNYAKDLNESLNSIQIVTGQSSAQMAAFAEKANKAAQALSTTTTKYTEAALIFYQQGLNDSQVEDRMNTVMKMMHATGDAASDVSSYMTAIWNNFDDGSESLEHYADVITALGASTASSSAEIAQGLSQFASIAKTTGLSYEYATSALATLVANTRQSADTIGTSLKTIFSRLQGVSLGKTLDDGVDLNKYSTALQKVGVEILDATGNMKDLDTILSDLAGRWQTLTSAQQDALAQTVAGTRQYTQLISLMSNWDDMEKNLQTASGSTGTLDKQQEIYAQSWEAASERVQAAAEEIYGALVDDKFFVTFLNGFKEVLNEISRIIDSVGGLQGVLTGLGAIITSVFNAKIGNAFTAMLSNLTIGTKQAQAEFVKLKQNAMNAVSTIGANKGNPESQGIADIYKARAASIDLLNGKIAQYKALQTDISAQDQAQIDLLSKQVDYQQQLAEAAIQQQQNNNTSLNNQNMMFMSSLQSSGVSGFTQVDLNSVLTGLSDSSMFTGITTSLENLANNGSWDACVERAKVLTDSIKNSMGDIPDAFKPVIEALEKLSTSSATNEQEVSGNLQSLKTAVITATADSSTAFSDFRTKLEAALAGNPQAQAILAAFDKLGLSARQAGESTGEAAVKTVNYNDTLKNFNTTVSSCTPQVASFSQVLVSLSSTLMSISTVITTVKSSVATLTNIDATPIEKFTAAISILTTGLFLLNSITKLSNQLATVFVASTTKSTAALGAEAVAATADAAAKEKLAVATKLAQTASVIGIVITAVTALAAAWTAAATAKAEYEKETKERLTKIEEDYITKTSEDTKKDSDEETERMKLIATYNDLYETYKKTGEGQEELAISARKLGEAYGIVGANIQIAAGNFEAFNNLLKQQLDNQYSGEKRKTQSRIDKGIDRLNLPAYNLSDTKSIRSLDDVQETNDYHLGVNGSSIRHNTTDQQNIKNLFSDQQIAEGSTLISFGSWLAHNNNPDYGNKIDEGQLLQSIKAATSSASEQGRITEEIVAAIKSGLSEAGIGSDIVDSIGDISDAIQIWNEQADQGADLSLSSLNLGQLALDEVKSRVTISTNGSEPEKQLYNQFTQAYSSGYDFFDENGKIIWDDLSENDKYDSYHKMKDWYDNNNIPDLYNQLMGAAQDAEDKTISAIFTNLANNLQDMMGQVEKVIGTKDAETTISKQIGVIDQAKEEQAKLEADKKTIANFIGKDHTSETLSQFISDQDTLAQIVANHASAYEELQPYLENGKVIDDKQGEFNTAVQKIVQNMIKQYTVFDDYAEMYADLQASFSDSSQLDQVVGLISEMKGDFGLENLTPEFVAQVMAYFANVAAKGEEASIEGLKQDSGVQSAIANGTTQSKMTTTLNNASTIRTATSSYKSSMNQSEAETFYNTIWKSGTTNTAINEALAANKESLISFEDFLAKSESERSEYLTHLATTYDNYAKTSASDAAVSAQKSIDDLAKTTQLRGLNIFKTDVSAVGGHGLSDIGKDAQALQNYINEQGYSYDTESQSYKKWDSDTQTWKKDENTGKDISKTLAEVAQEGGISGIFADVDAAITNNELQMVIKNIETLSSVQHDLNSDNDAGNWLSLVAKQASQASKNISTLSGALSSLPTTESDMKNLLGIINKSSIAQYDTKSLSDLYTNDNLGYQELILSTMQAQRQKMNNTDSGVSEYEKQLADIQIANTQKQITQTKTNNAISPIQTTISDLAEMDSTLKSIDITALPKAGTKAYQQLETALNKVGTSMKQFNDSNDVDQIKKIGEARKQVLQEEAEEQKRITALYAANITSNGHIMTQEEAIKAGKEEEWNKYKASLDKEQTIADSIIAVQEETSTKIDTIASNAFSVSIKKLEALQKEMKEKLDELKEAADAFSSSIETGELTFEQRAKISKAGQDSLLSQWDSATTKQERAMIATQATNSYYTSALKDNADTQTAITGARRAVNASAFSSTYYNNGRHGETDKFKSETDFQAFLNSINNATEQEKQQIMTAYKNAVSKGMKEGASAADWKQELTKQLEEMGVDAATQGKLLGAAWSDAIKNEISGVDQYLKEEAQKAVEAWQSAFDDIADMKEKLASGESISSIIAGDVEGTIKKLQQLKALGYNEEERKTLLNGGQVLNKKTGKMSGIGDILEYPEITPQLTQSYMVGQGYDLFAQGNNNDAKDWYARRTHGGQDWSATTPEELAGFDEAYKKALTSAVESAFSDDILQSAGYTKEGLVDQLIANNEAAWQLVTETVPIIKEGFQISEQAKIDQSELKSKITAAQTASDNAKTDYQETKKADTEAHTLLTNRMQGISQTPEQRATELLKSTGLTSQQLLDKINTEGGTDYKDLKDALSDENLQGTVDALDKAADDAGKTFVKAANDFHDIVVDAGDKASQSQQKAADTAQAEADDVGSIANKGTDNETVTLNKDALQSYREELAETYGFTTEQWDALEKQMDQGIQRCSQLYQELIKDADKYKKKLTEMAAKVANSEQGYEDLTKVSDATWKELAKGVNMASSTSYNAFKTIQSAAIKTFNSTAEVMNQEFIQKYQKELKQMATGTQEEVRAAQNTLESAVAKEYLLSLNVDSSQVDEAVDKAQDFFNKYDNEPVGFTVDVTTNGFEEAVSGFQTLLDTGQATVDQIQQAMNNLGWEPHVEYIEVTPGEVDESTGMLQVTDNKTGTVYTVASSSLIENDGVYRIPRIVGASKINSNSSRGRERTPRGGGSERRRRNKQMQRYDASNEKNGATEIERYHHITKSLESISHELNMIGKLKDKAFGKDKLKAIESETKALEKQKKAQQEYINEIKDWLQTDSANVIAAGYTLDSEGHIANYEENMEAAIEKYNAALREANAKTNQANSWWNSLSADAQEKEENEWKYDEMTKAAERISTAAEKEYQNTVDLLTQYEDTVSKLESAEETMQDINDQIRADLLEKITYTVELKVEVATDAMTVLEDRLKSIGDKADKAADALANFGDQMLQLEKKTEAYQTGITSILTNAGASGGLTQRALTNNLTQEDWVDISKLDLNSDEVSSLEEYSKSLTEMNESLRTMRTDALEKINTAFSEYNEDLDRNSTKIEHLQKVNQTYSDIIETVGKKVLDASGELTQMLDKADFEMQRNNTHALKSQLDFIDNSIADTKQQLEEAKAMGASDDTINALTESLETMEDERDSTYESWLDSWEAECEAAATIYEDTLENIIDTFEDAIAGTADSLSALSEEFNRQQTIDDTYLDEYDQIYQLSKLNRDITNSIDETDDVNAKKALKKLQEEINKAQEDGTELSQYDLDVLQKKYELELAREKLEDARDNKTQVRMQRDSEGNFGYVYTADADAVEKAEQEYEDKLYAMQQLNSEYIENMQEQIIQAEQDCSEALANLNVSDYATYEDYQAAAMQIQEDYGQLVEDYYDQLNNAITNNKELYDGLWTDYSKATGYQLGDEEEFITDFVDTQLARLTDFETIQDASIAFNDNLNDAMNDASAAWADWYEQNQIAMQDGGTTITDYADAVSDAVSGEGGLVDQGKAAEEAAESMRQSYETAFDGIIDALKNFLDTWEQYINNTISTNQLLAETIYDIIATAAGVAANNLHSDSSSTGTTTEVVSGYDTGGYTGTWNSSDGKLAFLHEKELVLNKDDTTNLLDAVDAVKNISNLIDLNAITASSGLANTLSAASNIPTQSETLEQNVQITAEFKDATTADQITGAFSNLINLASQYANKKE